VLHAVIGADNMGPASMMSDRRLQQIGLSVGTSRLYGPAIRGLLIVAAIGCGLFQIVTYARVAHATVTVRELADFEVFYRSSQRAAQGIGDPYAVAPKGANGITWTANLNPPHVVLALVALTWFTRETAFAIWIVLSVASAIWAIALIFRELELRVTVATVSMTVLALLLAAPTGALIFSAQIAWILWGPITFVWVSARRRQWIAAGLALGILTSIKPFLGLLIIAFMTLGHWIPAVLALATTVLCFSIGILTFGWAILGSWWRAVRSVTWAGHIFNVSLFGFLDRLFTGESSVWPLAPIGEFPALVWPAWMASTAAVLLLTWLAICRRPAATDAGGAGRDPRTIDQTFAATLSAAFLVSPLTWIYYLFFAAGPLIASAMHGAWWSSRWRTLVSVMTMIGLTLGPNTLTAGQPAGFATFSIGSAYFWAVLGLWICLWTLPDVTAIRATRQRPGS
jgi:hypothetical protein